MSEYREIGILGNGTIELIDSSGRVFEAKPTQYFHCNKCYNDHFSQSEMKGNVCAECYTKRQGEK